MQHVITFKAAQAEITQLSKHKDCDLIKYMQSVFQSEAWHFVPDSVFLVIQSSSVCFATTTITLFSIVM